MSGPATGGQWLYSTGSGRGRFHRRRERCRPAVATDISEPPPVPSACRQALPVTIFLGRCQSCRIILPSAWRCWLPSNEYPPFIGERVDYDRHSLTSAPSPIQDIFGRSTGLQTFSGLLAFAPQLPHSTVGLSERHLISSTLFAALSAHICSLWFSPSHPMVFLLTDGDDLLLK